MRLYTKTRANLALALLALCSAACADTSTGPEGQGSAQFPRAFSSLSASCVQFPGGIRVVAPDKFEQTTRLNLAETSTEHLFAGNAILVFTQTFNLLGELLGEESSGLYMPAAVDGTWQVTLSRGPAEESFTAVGIGDGDLSGRTIEFQLSPRSVNCGFESSGTIE